MSSALSSAALLPGSPVVSLPASETVNVITQNHVWVEVQRRCRQGRRLGDSFVCAPAEDDHRRTKEARRKKRLPRKRSDQNLIRPGDVSKKERNDGKWPPLCKSDGYGHARRAGTEGKRASGLNANWVG